MVMVDMNRKKKGKRVALVAGAVVLLVIALIAVYYRPEIRAWYVLATQFERLPANKQGYLEYRHKQTGIVFVRLPGGEFLMGTPADQVRRGLRAASPDVKDSTVEHVITKEHQHRVMVSPFLIAKYGAPGQAWERGKSCRAT